MRGKYPKRANIQSQWDMHDLLHYYLQYLADTVGIQPISSWNSLFSTHYPQMQRHESWLISSSISSNLMYNVLYLIVCACSVASVMSDSANPWTSAHQVPLSMGFFRLEYWNGLPCYPPGIFPTQGSNLSLLHLLHCRQILHPVSHLGSPIPSPRGPQQNRSPIRHIYTLSIGYFLFPVSFLHVPNSASWHCVWKSLNRVQLFVTP